MSQNSNDEAAIHLIKSTARESSDKPMNHPTNSDGDPNKNKIEAIIGASIKINGDISGKEDLLINGTVEGTVDFRENYLVIGAKGNLNANVIAKNISVEGEIKGELRGGEQVTIKPSGRVIGDIRAPRVILNDGCQFKGSVDMDEKPSTVAGSRSTATKLAGAKPLGRTATDTVIPRKL